MISVTSAQLLAWIAAFVYPAVRVFAFVATAPVFSNTSIPLRSRVTLGVALSVGILPLVDVVPAIDPGSGQGLFLIAREMLVGVAIGFVMRIAFAAVSLAGELIGFQMGLGFAVFFDPQSTGQTPVISQFVTLLATLVFLAMNGHLMMVATLAQSFQLIPIQIALPHPGAWWNIVIWGHKIFAVGLLLSLPVTVALLVTSMALGILARAAPQLNLLAIGFPITIVGGFSILIMTLWYLSPPLMRLYEAGLTMMLEFAG